MPIGALVLIGAALRVTEGRAGDRAASHLLGAVLVTTGLAAVAYGIVQTEAEGWTAAATLVPLLSDSRCWPPSCWSRRGPPSPLVPLRVFSVRAVSSANDVDALLMGSATFSMWYFMTVYAQNVLGYTPLQAGLALIPTSAAVVIGSKLAPASWSAPGRRASPSRGS